LDLLTLRDYSAEQIKQLLALAATLKKQRLQPAESPFFGKSAVLIFEKPSLRTRLTFETAIFEMGGNCVNLDPTAIGMGTRESVQDIARNMERWVHLIVARTFSQKTLDDLSHWGKTPVINALSDLYHPCQALAFGLTLSEQLPDVASPHICYLGDGNNVAHSLMILCAKLGYACTICCPEGYEPDTSVVSYCKEQSQKSIRIEHDVKTAVRGADVLYTDVWASMGQESEQIEREKVFAPYQLNSEVVKATGKRTLVSHCLPAHRGEEITSEVLDSSNSIAFEEAENRLHAQKAVIHYLARN